MIKNSLLLHTQWLKDNPEKLKENVIGYLDNTSVHGLKYLSERKRPRIERVTWALCFLLSLGVCVFFVSKTWRRWAETPVIIAMDETQRAVWQIPFPAVTICPQAKFSADSKHDYNDYVLRNQRGKLSRKERDALDKIQLVCRERLLKGSAYINNSAITLIEEVALKEKDFLVHTTFRNNDAKFQPLLTEEGMCYTFNMLPSSKFFKNCAFQATRNYLKDNSEEVNWDTVNGYDPSITTKFYPRRTLGSGKDTGLRLKLQIRKDDTLSYCSLVLGFKILLHTPVDFPAIGQKSILVPHSRLIQISVSPQEYVTSDKLRVEYKPHERQCFFPGERPLQFFHHYTQKNCELECLANRTLDRCKCVSFYMPRLNKASICGEGNKACEMEVAAGFFNQELENDMKSMNKPDPPCGCLPSCTYIAYNTEMTQLETNTQLWKEFEQKVKNNTYKGTVYHTDLDIYFKDTLFVPIRRMEVFGTSDLLANCGGVLGLCMGMSFLSVLEILYWLLIRPCRRREKAKENATTGQLSMKYSKQLDEEAPSNDPETEKKQGVEIIKENEI